MFSIEIDVDKTTQSSKTRNREAKRDAIISRNREMINSFLNVLYYANKKNLPSLCIEAWQSLENIERGSLS